MKFTWILNFLVLIIVMSSCGGKDVVKNSERDGPLPENVIQNQLIVQLKAGVEPEYIIESFKGERLRLEEELSSHMRAYLFSFDSSKIDPILMLSKVKSHDGVSSAEFNKKLSVRD